MAATSVNTQYDQARKQRVNDAQWKASFLFRDPYSLLLRTKAYWTFYKLLKYSINKYMKKYIFIYMSGYVNYCKYINKVLIINLFCTAFNFTGEPWAVNQRRSLSSQERRSRLRSSLWFYLGRKWIVCIKNIRHYHESLSLSLKPRSLSTDTQVIWSYKLVDG